MSRNGLLRCSEVSKIAPEMLSGKKGFSVKRCVGHKQRPQKIFQASLQDACLLANHFMCVVVSPIARRRTDSHACLLACHCGEGHHVFCNVFCNQVEYSLAQSWKLGLTCSWCHFTVFSAMVVVAVTVAVAATVTATVVAVEVR